MGGSAARGVADIHMYKMHSLFIKLCLSLPLYNSTVLCTLALVVCCTEFDLNVL